MRIYKAISAPKIYLVTWGHRWMIRMDPEDGDIKMQEDEDPRLSWEKEYWALVFDNGE